MSWKLGSGVLALHQFEIVSGNIGLFAIDGEHTHFENHVAMLIEILAEELPDLGGRNVGRADSDFAGGLVRRIILGRATVRDAVAGEGDGNSRQQAEELASKGHADLRGHLLH
jgi:hypothetical protein